MFPVSVFAGVEKVFPISEYVLEPEGCFGLRYMLAVDDSYTVFS